MRDTSIEQQRKEFIEAILELIATALTIQKTTPHKVFIRYSGHVDNIEFTVYENGWSAQKEASKTFESYLTDPDGDPAWITKVDDYFQHLLSENKNATETNV